MVTEDIVVYVRAVIVVAVGNPMSPSVWTNNRVHGAFQERRRGGGGREG